MSIAIDYARSLATVMASDPLVKDVGGRTMVGMIGSPAIVDPYDRIANLMKVLSHPVRLHILDLTRRDAECVCHLETVLHRPQPYISQQLRVLREAGVIVDNKDGLNIFYHLADAEVASLLNVALGPVLPNELRARQRLPNCNCPKCAVPAGQEIRLMVGS